MPIKINTQIHIHQKKENSLPAYRLSTASLHWLQSIPTWNEVFEKQTEIAYPYSDFSLKIKIWNLMHFV